MSQFVIDTTKVVAAMRARSLSGQKTMSVKVGYEAPHAVYVHEDMEANHPNGGQAKYLSTPARDPKIRQAMRMALKAKLMSKRSLEEGCIDAGNILIAASQPLVPVDTGELRDSVFIDTVSRGRVKAAPATQAAPPSADGTATGGGTA